MGLATHSETEKAAHGQLIDRVATAISNVPLALFRFMSSVKLAVLSIGSLAAVLAYATFFESWYGTAAVQEWIYRSRGFAIVLLFLATNILCAALIRFPWKRRQTGFVITHAGLLTVLAGSLITWALADEGQVALLEGTETSQLVRPEWPTIRVQPIDRETGKPLSEFAVPFRPTTFDWKLGDPRPRGFFESAFHGLSGGLLDDGKTYTEVLTPPKSKFQLWIKAHLPASIGVWKHAASPNGDPMIKASLLVKAPQSLSPMDVLENPADAWLVADDRTFRRIVENAPPVQFAFQYATSDEMVSDFLELPGKLEGKEAVVRIRYKDRLDKPSIFDWRIGDPALKTPYQLPDSDLTVTSAEGRTIPSTFTMEGSTIDLSSKVGDRTVDMVIVKVRQGQGPESNQFAFSMLPIATEILEREGDSERNPQAVRLSYFHPPKLNPQQKRGFIEVMGDSKGNLYYRAFTLSGSKGPAPLKLGEEVNVLGGGKSPMKGSLVVYKYLPKGVEKLSYEPIKLGKQQLGSGIPAALVEMKVGDETQEFWIRRGRDLDPHFQTRRFADGDYKIAYDFDRRDLGFNVKLDKFEVRFDPGTEQAKSYRSDVRVDDPPNGLRDRPYVITMNNPMVQRSWTFYQSGFDPVRDPDTDRETGVFKSILQVGYDPGRALKYLGCGLVLMGAFVQFYMKAGIFTDGGKRERRIEEARKLAAEQRAGSASKKK